MIFKELAKAFNMNISELADAMGGCRQLLYELNHGRRVMTAKKLREMFKRLEVIDAVMLECEQKEANQRAEARKMQLEAVRTILIERGLLPNEG